jgi:hypothetical protein
MKNLFVIFYLAAALLILSLDNAWAQHPQVTVIQGTTHTYSVTPVPNGANYEYHWSVTGGTSSNFPNTNNSGNIIWDGAPGQYTMTVYAVNPSSRCAGNNQTLIVNVVAMGGFTLTGPAEVCPRTDNQSGDFVVNIAYSGGGEWSFTLNDGLTDRTVNVAAGTSSSALTIPGYSNLSSINVATHVLRITSVTTAEGTVVYDGNEADIDNHRIMVNVQPTPATSGIIQN